MAADKPVDEGLDHICCGLHAIPRKNKARSAKKRSSKLSYRKFYKIFSRGAFFWVNIGASRTGEIQIASSLVKVYNLDCIADSLYTVNFVPSMYRLRARAREQADITEMRCSLCSTCEETFIS
ncbi:hypothetical protein D1007_41445 [Hordeum vulgare]|nr:hypothetical protein D1007_41445 [Hordeum vulgare]